jgi:hypothetical protein
MAGLSALKTFVIGLIQKVDVGELVEDLIDEE